MAKDPLQTVDLVDLVSSTGSTTIYPNDDAILSLLQSRFRADLPYTRINDTTLVVVNPLKALANTNDESAKDYEERSYKDVSTPGRNSPSIQPHPYDTAARMYLLMRRTGESQSVIFRCVCYAITTRVMLIAVAKGDHRLGQVEYGASAHKSASSPFDALEEGRQDC